MTHYSRRLAEPPWPPGGSSPKTKKWVMHRLVSLQSRQAIFGKSLEMWK